MGGRAGGPGEGMNAKIGETLEKAADIRTVTRLLVKRPPPGAVTAAAKPPAAQGKGNTLLETSWVP